MLDDLPQIALSIRQPWAFLIVNGFKDIENRDWRTNYRGPVLIHAGAKMERDALADLYAGRHPVTGAPFEAARAHPAWSDLFSGRLCGGLVGTADVYDCVEASASPWFVGDYGFAMRGAMPLPFLASKGALGFYKARYEAAA